jgi:hypothetical protein
LKDKKRKHVYKRRLKFKKKLDLRNLNFRDKKRKEDAKKKKNKKELSF